jgi:hypothetical protein
VTHLSAAQFLLARRYRFPGWARLLARHFQQQPLIDLLQPHTEEPDL